MILGDAGPSNKAELELELIYESEESDEESGEDLHANHKKAAVRSGTRPLLPQSVSTDRKGKARLVEDVIEAREDRQREPIRHQNLCSPIVDDSSHVFLLQSILGSSHFERIASKFRFPISGHWAIQIRGDVFELNRMESWIKTSIFPASSAGARSQIDSQTRQEYEAARGAWSITSSYLGKVTMSQDEIFKIGE